MTGAHDGDRRVDLGQILVLRSVGGEDLIELEGRMTEQMHGGGAIHAQFHPLDGAQNAVAPFDGGLELGVPGAVLSALFWAWMIWSLVKVEARDRTLAAVGAATALAYLTIGALSFGIWQEWWLALGALAAGVFALSNVSSAAHVRTRQAYYQ